MKVKMKAEIWFVDLKLAEVVLEGECKESAVETHIWVGDENEWFSVAGH